MCIVFAAAVWALWLPMLIVLSARHQFAAAIAWALLPSVFLSPVVWVGAGDSGSRRHLCDSAKPVAWCVWAPPRAAT